MQNQPENKKTTLPVITEVSENVPIKVKNTAERRKSKFQPFDSYLDFEIKSDEDAKDNEKSAQMTKYIMENRPSVERVNLKRTRLRKSRKKKKNPDI